jgi:hypothetical protein
MPWALVSCGPEPGSPEAAVEAFLDACQDGDEPAMFAVIQASDRELLRKLRDQGGQHSFGPGAGFDYEIGDIRTRGVTATCEVRLSKDGEEETQSLALIKEEGQWRVDLVPDEMVPLFEGLDGMMESMAEGMGRSMEDAMRSMASEMQRELGEKR